MQDVSSPRLGPVGEKCRSQSGVHKPRGGSRNFSNTASIEWHSIVSNRNNINNRINSNNSIVIVAIVVMVVMVIIVIVIV